MVLGAFGYLAMPLKLLKCSRLDASSLSGGALARKSILYQARSILLLSQHHMDPA